MEQDQGMEVPLVAPGSVEQECGVGKSPLFDSHGYVLRENPKKSWKFSGFSHDEDDVSMDRKNKVHCKVCGKEFASLFALNGHLKLHTGEEKIWVRCDLCGSRFKSERGLNGHVKMHSESRFVYVEYGVAAAVSDAETMNLVRKKRSKRARYRYRYRYSSPDLSGFSDSVSGFEFDHDEEEVAESLLLLSSGAGTTGWSSFIPDSLGSTSTSASCKDDSLPEQAKDGRFGSSADSEIVVDERVLVSCHETEVVSSEIQSDHVIGLASGVGEEGIRFRCEANKEGAEDVTGLAHTNSISSCDVGMEDYVLERKMGNSPPNFVAKIGNRDEDSKFKCKICNRMFATHQSLGGHQTSHRLTKCSISMKTEVCEFSSIIPPDVVLRLKGANRGVRLEHAEPSVEQETDDAKEVHHRLQTPKEFKCSICCKIFPSGQALGGHKRAHWVPRASYAMQHDVADISQLMDLDIPCPVDSEANHDAQLKPLCAGGSCKQEAPVGIVG